jgi:hypothetical protein
MTRGKSSKGQAHKAVKSVSVQDQVSEWLDVQSDHGDQEHFNSILQSQASVPVTVPDKSVQHEDTVPNTSHTTNSMPQDNLDWLLSRMQMDNVNSKGGYMSKGCSDLNSGHNNNSPCQVSLSNRPQAVDPLVYLTGSKRSEALDICDFVNLSPPVRIDVGACNGPGEVLEEFYKAKTGVRRPKLQDVTVAQWGLANSRIMDQLFFCDGAPGEGVRHYLAYSAKVFEMFGKFDKVSVLEYDRRYRIYQAASDPPFVWGTDVPHLDTMALASASTSKPGYRSSYTNARPSSQDTKVPKTQHCNMYNTIQGCRFGTRCNFLHQCHKCTGPHPQFIHDQPPPGVAAPQVSNVVNQQSRQ